ncbi:cyclic nucleotide-binding domain-containing protein [Lacticaseibacillus daqingensis]|uniref:cyclic nucleotide-binding domain-containing protein n=1 Tax=Lacticaseibacillus daqingensis TaxID=2486014 RepID=UPI000F7759F4|nr:cyclic nucleotide-binding domain-containing protein [Lacticaseibacillus daqingensis]
MLQSPWGARTDAPLAAFPFLTDAVLRQCVCRTFGDREPLVTAGAPVPDLMIVLRGRARIMATAANGKAALLQFVQPGDLLGELTLVGAEDAAKAVLAIGPVACLAIPQSVIEAQLATAPAFWQLLAQHIGVKLLRRMTHMASAQTQAFKYRLAELMLTVAVAGVYQENNVQIADYLGVSYRHLMYTLRQFREAGLIAKQPGGYRLDAPAMRAFLTAGDR